MKKNGKADYIIVGCDLHEKSMLIKFAADKSEPKTKTYAYNRVRRQAMIEDLKKLSASHGDAKVVFAYEASGLGFTLCRELRAAGIDCQVIPPNKVDRSPHYRRNKTDEIDATRMLELLRSHVLAGNELPTCHVPTEQECDDREVTRARQDVAEKITTAKTQLTSLLKCNGIEESEDVGNRWTKYYRAWLKKLPGARLGVGAGNHMLSLLRQIEFLEQELEYWTKEIEKLAQTQRHGAAVQAMTAEKGVGIVTAMTFRTEVGDPSRFKKSRQVSAFLGLVPSASESGEVDDRKGHITKQGPSRVRAVLNQAAWSFIRTDQRARAKYDRIVARNPKKKKIAQVAAMHDLAVHLWRRELAAQRAAAATAGT
jgi:transposase